MQGNPSFQKIMHDYNASDDNITDPNLISLYSSFNFEKLTFQNSEEETKNNLLSFLRKYKFITYEIIPEIENQKDISSNSKNEIQLSETCKVVICVEKQCLIIESIKKIAFQEIIQEIKSVIIDYKSKPEITEEVTSFCDHYKYQIKNNLFLKLTIKTIATYIIRRHFYPSNFFNDQTFFTFDKKEEENFDFTQFNYDEMVKKVNKDKQEMNNDNKKQIINFNEDEFIQLRIIYWNENFYFYLVLHIKSLYLFVMKKVLNYGQNIDHEIEFCENYQHRCIAKFYGFIKKNQNVLCFIYEFFSNGNLQNFITNKQNNIDEYYMSMTFIRIMEGINYLHSKSLIYRDLKPLN